MKNLTFDQLPQAVGELFGKLENIEQLLKAGAASPVQETNDLLTIQQAGEFLRLSVPTLYGYVSKSTIPYSKRLGSKRLWFSKQELTDWIKTGRKQTVAEVNAEVEQTLSPPKEMRIEPSNNAKGKDIYTLAQSEPPLFDKPTLNPPIIVRGKGVDIGNDIQLQKWAKRKLINNYTLYKLIEVAEEYGDKDFVQQCWNTYHCLSEVYTANGKLYGKYCGNRQCRLCCDIRTAEIINEYSHILLTWKKACHVVLTVKSPTLTGLKKRIDEMYAAFKKIVAKYRRGFRKDKCIKLVGIRSFECLYNPESKTYHCHFHLIVKTKEMGEILKNEWCKYWKRTFANPEAQKVIPVWDMEGALVEVIKYSCKIFKDPTNDQTLQGMSNPTIYANALYCMYKAMKGRRIFDRFGFNKKKPAIPKKGTFTKLYEYKKWYFDPKSADYINPDLDFPLIGFDKPPELEQLLETCFDTELN